MNNLIESKAFPWAAAVLVGALMGFLVGPAMTGWTMHETLPVPFRFALFIIVAGIVGLVIEKALARRPAAVAPGRKEGKVDKLFGVGRVLYTVTPHEGTGRLQFNVTTHGVGGKRFREVLLPMLTEIEGVEWGNPIEPSPYMQRQALKRFGERRDAVEVGTTPPPALQLERGVAGVITSEASLLRVIEMIEERLGSAQPL